SGTNRKASSAAALVGYPRPSRPPATRPRQRAASAGSTSPSRLSRSASPSSPSGRRAAYPSAIRPPIEWPTSTTGPGASASRMVAGLGGADEVVEPIRGLRGPAALAVPTRVGHDQAPAGQERRHEGRPPGRVAAVAVHEHRGRIAVAPPDEAPEPERARLHLD